MVGAMTGSPYVLAHNGDKWEIMNYEHVEEQP